MKKLFKIGHAWLFGELKNWRYPVDFLRDAKKFTELHKHYNVPVLNALQHEMLIIMVSKDL